MSFIPAINVMKGTLEWTLAGQVVVITLNFQKGTAVAQIDLQNLANALLTWWTTRLKPQMVASAVLTGIRTADQTSVNGPTYFLPVSPGQPGTDAGTAQPSNVAACVTFRTGQRGRSFRGRCYLPALSQNNQVDAGHMTSGKAVDIATAFANLTDVETSEGVQQVVVSRYSNGAPRATALTTTVESYVVDTVYDSQRRRLPLRGA